MKYISVCTDAGIDTLAAVASDIWYEYWPEHIGADQTDYMVNNFQSKQAITKQIREEGYLYFLIVAEGKIVGYCGVHPEEQNGRLFLSKLYLYASERGKGYAKASMQFLIQLCKFNNLRAIYLTVNKYNDLAIRAYKAAGFETIDSVETDIGDGFIMDDFIMEKVLG